MGVSQKERQVRDPAEKAALSVLEQLGCRQPSTLLGSGVAVRYRRGEVISPAEVAHLHLVLEGAIQTVYYAASGRAVLVHQFDAGHTFGGFEMLGDPAMPVYAVAKGVVTAWRLRGWSLADAARADSELGRGLLEEALSVISDLARRLVELTVERARDRVRLELVRQARRDMVDEHTGRVRSPPTHSEFAAQIGSHREEVTRELSYLKERALIERTGKALLVRVDAIESLYRQGRRA